MGILKVPKKVDPNSAMCKSFWIPAEVCRVYDLVKGILQVRLGRNKIHDYEMFIMMLDALIEKYGIEQDVRKLLKAQTGTGEGP